MHTCVLRVGLPSLLLLLLPLAASLSAAPAYGPRDFGDHPGYTALVTAYEPETEALLEALRAHEQAQITETHRFRGVEYFIGEYQGEPILVFATGISVPNAAMTVQMALDYFPVKQLLFAGVSGGVNPELETGDVTIVERWYYHDESGYFNPDGEGGYILADYFEHHTYFNPENRPDDPHIPDYTNFGMIFPTDVSIVKDGVDDPLRTPYFSADADLMALAQAVADNPPPLPLGDGRESTLHIGGNGVTGSVFVDNAEYRKWLRKVWRAEVLEMESAAIAQVCDINGVPWLQIRSVSDLAGGQEGKNVENEYAPKASVNATRVLFALLDQLTQ